MSGGSGKTPYEVLKCEPFCSLENVKSSYKKLVLMHHPDKKQQAQNSQSAQNNNENSENDKFIEIQAAYRFLVHNKKMYDIILGSLGSDISTLPEKLNLV